MSDTKTFTVYSPFSKVEDQPDGTLMVFGRATHEVVDSANEIMDYASSAPLFQRRSQENSDRSDGENLMPLRSMHQNIAAGKVVQFDYKDSEKAIDIGAMVVDPVEISKVKTHVYTGFSVGGKYARRWPDGGSMRFTADPREISLVDAPAVPTAKLTLFKVDGDNNDNAPEWVEDFKKAVQEAKQIQQSQLEEKEDQLIKSKTIGENIGIAYREGSPLIAPNNSISAYAEYGDPANFAFPVYRESLCKASIDRFNNRADMDKYSPKEWHILGRRLVFSANQFGQYAYDPILSKITHEVNIMPNEMQKLDVGAVVSALKAQGAQAAALASTDPNAALANILGLIDSLATGSPIIGQNVPVTDPSIAMGKAVAGGTSPSATAATEGDSESTATSPPTSSTTTAPVKKGDVPPQFKAKAKDKATAPTSEETESETETSTDSEPTEAYKKLDAKVDALANSVSSLVEALTKRAQAVAPADSPVGALNAMVKVGGVDMPSLDETEAKIIKEIEAGGPYAMLKALKIADPDGDNGGALAFQIVNNAVRKASYDSLERGGVITAKRYQGRLYSSQ